MASNWPLEEGLISGTASLSLADGPSRKLSDEDKCAKYYEKGTWEKRVSLLFESRDFADVTFILKGDDAKSRRIQAHRLILASRSPTFFEMFYGPKPDNRDEIYITDVEPDDFELLLRYMYGEEVKIGSTRQATEVLKLAGKYQPPGLVEFCSQHVEQCLNGSNAVTLFQESVLNGVPELVIKSLLFIINEADKVLEETIPNDILPSTLKFLLRVHVNHGFNIPSEEKLLERLIEWARWHLNVSRREAEASTLRKIIDPLLPYIPFLRMSPEALREKAAVILSKEEIESILKNIELPNSALLPPWCSHEMTAPNAYSRHETTSLDFLLTGTESYFYNLSENPKRESVQLGSISLGFRAKEKVMLTGFSLQPCLNCDRYLICGTMGLLKGSVLVTVENNFSKRFDIIPPGSTSFTSYVKAIRCNTPIYVNVGEHFKVFIEFEEGCPLVYSCKSSMFSLNEDIDFVGDVDNPTNCNSKLETWCIFSHLCYVKFNI